MTPSKKQVYYAKVDGESNTFTKSGADWTLPISGVQAMFPLVSQSIDSQFSLILADGRIRVLVEKDHEPVKCPVS